MHGGWNYTYDGNGNVKNSTYLVDNTKSKNITAYNILNLPQTGTAAGTAFTYTYDATGQKLRKVAGTATTDYIYGIQYTGTTTTDPSINFIQTEEGRAVNNGTGYDYEYTLADHLGNSRVNFSTAGGSAAATQVDDYYAFGMDISRTPPTPVLKNEYLYNGKELQEELGTYDYGARFYDPVIGRWTSVDPLAEKYRRFSPYNYADDNPIVNLDPDGNRVVFAPGVSESFKQKFAQTVKFMNAHHTSGRLARLQESSQTYYISETNGNVNSFDSKTNTIAWNPNLAKITTNFESLSPATLLGHELDHARQHDKNPKQQEKDSNTPDKQYDTKEEKRVITGSEQTTAKAHGDIGEGEVTRTDHNMKSYIPVSDPTSNGTVKIVSHKPKKNEKE
ncbi:MAG TPA: RHS repeat-associated core domain-containing protein [Mucilaginibacter sp.]|nr:RHS repeat-associated core domain-containing protein [Mucilaginibacter sp.]